MRTRRICLLAIVGAVAGVNDVLRATAIVSAALFGAALVVMLAIASSETRARTSSKTSICEPARTTRGRSRAAVRTRWSARSSLVTSRARWGILIREAGIITYTSTVITGVFSKLRNVPKRHMPSLTSVETKMTTML